jgi:hypothetical protein
MMPIDKFGNIIFPSKFRKLKEYEKVLLAMGYHESKNKPNLFSKKSSQGCFFADMRGTEEVPIWVDTRPLFYWNFEPERPRWERRRLIKKELKNLFNSCCLCRLSFYAPHSSVEFEETSTFIDEERGVFIWDDGYCRLCGKDFQDEGSFCSKLCKEKYKDTLKKPCKVCKKKIPFFKEIKHHISYFPEKTIFVHASCHNKIHKTNLYQHFKPSKEEIDKYYKQ